MPNYTTGLECSKAIKDAGIEEIRTKYGWLNTEHRWMLRGDRYSLSSNIGYFPKNDEYMSYSLSELVEVFKLLGEKKGWGEIEGVPEVDNNSCPTCGCTNIFYGHKWVWCWLKLCDLWITTQSQEKCDEFIINLLTNE